MIVRQSQRERSPHGSSQRPSRRLAGLAAALVCSYAGVVQVPAIVHAGPTLTPDFNPIATAPAGDPTTSDDPRPMSPAVAGDANGASTGVSPGSLLASPAAARLSKTPTITAPEIVAPAASMSPSSITPAATRLDGASIQFQLWDDGALGTVMPVTHTIGNDVPGAIVAKPSLQADPAKPATTPPLLIPTPSAFATGLFGLFCLAVCSSIYKARAMMTR